MEDGQQTLCVELPQYRSHKIVRAGRISGMERSEGGVLKIACLIPEGTCIIETEVEWLARYHGSSADPGYFVRYEDGYESWSPSKAFEEGYTRMDGVTSPRQTTREAVARGWCHDKNQGKEMDADLAEAIAKEVQEMINADYSPKLGCATTRELFEELMARSDNLDYRTVDIDS